MSAFLGYHSEWNLGSPGGWDYQRVNQEISIKVWERLQKSAPAGVRLDFNHKLLYPVVGFTEMLVREHLKRPESDGGLVAVIAEEETLDDVTENINLAARLDAIAGVKSALMAPHHLELKNGKVSYQGSPVTVAFIDFNTDVLLALHRKHDLSPLLQAVREGRVINPRGTEPINVKSMFEVISVTHRDRFDKEIVGRTPWTLRFFERSGAGPSGEAFGDILEYTRANWENLVLKPERGYSGKGVMVGGITCGAEEAIGKALAAGDYILQEKVPLNLWAEDIPEFDAETGAVNLNRVQTDFRCLLGPERMFGFLGRYGGVPTNVGSGGGVQPLAVLQDDMSVRDAVNRANDAIMGMDPADVAEAVELQHELACAERFTYLLGPIKIALRPRIVTQEQLEALARYCRAMWNDCLTLEKMWKAGELDGVVSIEEEELEIARTEPWGGSAAIIASDGLFSFGAHPEE